MFEAIKRTLSKYNKKKNLAKIRLGICAMDKKAKSKPMKEILKRLPEELFEIIIFGDECILNLPIESWPVVDCLIAFYSTRFPSQKALDYVKLRKPFMINDLEMDAVLKDRRKVYQILQQEGIDVPFHVLCERDDPNEVNVIEEFDEYIVVNGVQVNKPLVEKPVDAENHNIYIYYPMSAGGGSKRLFRKVDDRSSEFYPHMNDVRREGSYIYEQFVVTQGTDVKVYTVGPDYGHAEARKSPVVDGRVNRDKDGLEVRFPVILSPTEKDIARKIVRAFRQTVCGFDILRVHGKSYCCDVNGFSFVKNSRKYYDDASQVLVEIMISTVRPDLHLTLSTRAPLVRPRPQPAVARRDFREIASLSGRRDKDTLTAISGASATGYRDSTALLRDGGGGGKDNGSGSVIGSSSHDSNNIMPVVQVVSAGPTTSSSLSLATGFVNMMRRNSVDDVTTYLRGGANSTSASPSIDALENSVSMNSNNNNNNSSINSSSMSERLSIHQPAINNTQFGNNNSVTSSPSLPNFATLQNHNNHNTNTTTTAVSAHMTSHTHPSSTHTPFAVTPNVSVPNLHSISGTTTTNNGNGIGDNASEYGGTNNRMSPTASLNSLELDKEELRCVIGIIRHGDRTPKQKMKLVISEARYLDYFHHYSGSSKKDLKVKSKSALLRFLEVTREVISDPTMMKENKVLLRKLKQIKDVLERWEISGINRKLQMKPAKWEEVSLDSTTALTGGTGGSGSSAMMNRDRGVSSSPFLVRQGTASSDPAMYIASSTNCFTTTGNIVTSTCSSNAATNINSEGSTSNNNNNGVNNSTNNNTNNNNSSNASTGSNSVAATAPTQLRATEVLLILKWGGDLTPLGRKQAEELGESFRYMMYPDTGGGMLRLHATYRHDLKIKASDEGRVMKTAAAFAKGLLELEGPLTPILASLVTVEEKSTQMLDREGNRDIKEEMDRCKEHLNLLQFDKELTEDFVNIIAPDCNSAQKAAILRLGNPMKSLQKMHSLIGSLCDQLHVLIKNVTPLEFEHTNSNGGGGGMLHDSHTSSVSVISAAAGGGGTVTPINSNATSSRPESARILPRSDSHNEGLLTKQQQQQQQQQQSVIDGVVMELSLSPVAAISASSSKSELIIDGVVMNGNDTTITTNTTTSVTNGVDVDGVVVSDATASVSSSETPTPTARSVSSALQSLFTTPRTGDGKDTSMNVTATTPPVAGSNNSSSTATIDTITQSVAINHPSSEVVPHVTSIGSHLETVPESTVLPLQPLSHPLSISLSQSSSQQSEPEVSTPASPRTALYLTAESLSDMPVLPRQDSIGLDIKDVDTIATFIMQSDNDSNQQQLQQQQNENICTVVSESNGNDNSSYHPNNINSNSTHNHRLNINEDKPFSLADLDITGSSVTGSGLVSMNNSFHGGHPLSGMSASLSAASGVGGEHSIHMLTSNTKLPPRLYLDETLQLMADRWEKLFKDFYNAKLGLYDLSKVPDIYDAIRYEVLHNCHLKLEGMKELYELSMLFENTVVPQEYGIDRNDKRKIGAMMCHFLLEKIKYDLMTSSCEDAHMSDMRFQLDEAHAEDLAINSFGRSVRTRLYFTSESHLHTLLNVLRYAGDDVGEPYAIDKVGIEKLDSISELSYLTQVLIRLFEDREDPTKFRCEISFSPGAVCDPFTNKTSELCPTILLNKSIPVETLIACLDSAINVGYGLDTAESQDHLSTIASYNMALFGNNNTNTNSSSNMATTAMSVANTTNSNATAAATSATHSVGKS